MDDYLSGNVRAHLEAAQVTGSWGHGEGTSRRISIANKAFDIYFDSMAQIRRCRDGGRRSKMVAELMDTATDGWGFGVDDLQEAFKHLIDNQGRWTDDAINNYYPGPDKVYPGRTIGFVSGRYEFAGLAQGPASCVEFLNAVDKRMADLRDIAQRYQNTVDQALQNSQWRRLGDVLDFVDTWGSRAEKLLWWAPEVQTHFGTVTDYSGTLGEIHAALTEYATLTGRSGLSGPQAASFVALRRGLEKLPILGKFYAKALEMIPNSQRYFRELFDYYNRRINQAVQQATASRSS